MIRRDEEHMLRRVLRTAAITGETKKMRWKRCAPMRLENYWTESGRGNGRSSVIPATVYDGISQGKEEATHFEVPAFV